MRVRSTAVQGIGTVTVALLAAFGLAAGVGITAIGPGGVLATIGLLLLTGLGPAGVAGTAIVTHVATGALGSLAYYRSGQLRQRSTRRVALVLGMVALIGTPIGVLCNELVSPRLFGWLLAAAVALAGVLVWMRGHLARVGRPPRGTPPTRIELQPRRTPPTCIELPPRRTPPTAVIAAIGIAVSVAAGMFGLGGPMLAVPLLVIAGVPVLSALGAAQGQSVIIAATGTVSYLLHGSIDWPLAVVVGVPELAGVLLGHRLAHTVPAASLTYALGLALIVLAPWIALHG